MNYELNMSSIPKAFPISVLVLSDEEITDGDVLVF